MLRPRAAWLPTIVTIALLAACSSSEQARQAPVPSTTSAPATTTPSTVRIVALTGPPSPVDCNAQSSIQLHWKTQGATKVELRIDGGPVFATFGGGPKDPLVPLTCDGLPHTYQVTALAANSQPATRTFRVTEHALVS